MQNTEKNLLLEKYFLDVYGLTTDLSQFRFPALAGLPGYMAVPPELSISAIIDGIKKTYAVEVDTVGRDVKDFKDHHSQERPNSLYAFIHRDQESADPILNGKDILRISAANTKSATLKEYLLINGFHRFTKGRFMNGPQHNSTVTSSFWFEQEGSSSAYQVASSFTPAWGNCSDTIELYVCKTYEVRDNGHRELFML